MDCQPEANAGPEYIELIIAGTGTPDYRIPSIYLKSDGRMREWLWIEVGGSAQPYTPEFT